jgi:hypothetical protein
MINPIRTFFSTAILFLCLLCSTTAYSQVTRLRGNVYDAETKEPMPFVNVSIEGTSIGTITGFNGEFFIETRNQANFLGVSYLGYKPFRSEIKPGIFQTFEIYLEPETIELQEIVVVPGENPAHRVLRKIIENKDKNNPDRFDRYQYEIYNKMELDINNITEEYKSKKAFKQFQFIFDYIDTSAITGKTFLPIFITETLSDFYYQKQPQKRKEVIKANKISGARGHRVHPKVPPARPAFRLPADPTLRLPQQSRAKGPYRALPFVVARPAI